MLVPNCEAPCKSRLGSDYCLLPTITARDSGKGESDVEQSKQCLPVGWWSQQAEHPAPSDLRLHILCPLNDCTTEFRCVAHTGGVSVTTQLMHAKLMEVLF